MDVYAIGCLALFLATGREVYEEEMQVGAGETITCTAA